MEIIHPLTGEELWSGALPRHDPYDYGLNPEEAARMAERILAEPLRGREEQPARRLPRRGEGNDGHPFQGLDRGHVSDV